MSTIKPRPCAFRALLPLAIAEAICSIPIAPVQAADVLDASTQFAIAPQTLESALLAYSEQAEVQLVAASEVLPDVRVSGITGRYNRRDALVKLLASTGLSYAVDAGGVVSVTTGTDAQQTAAPASPQAPQALPEAGGAGASTEEPAQLDMVTVTGSRIPRAGFDTLEPAIVVGEDYIENRGLTNIADALNEIPGFGAGVTPQGGQATFGVGVNFVNRFGLGSARTLTLINGRRVVSANTPSIFGPAAAGLQVDLNIIPTQLVDRVENIAVGGAPTYGSDAIAGVVNVILKRDFEGLEARTTYGLSDRGDNERYNGSLLFGHNFAEGRGNFTISAAIDNSDGVLGSERERFSQAFAFVPNPTATLNAQLQPGRTSFTDGRINPFIPFNTSNTDGIPNAVLIKNARTFTFTAGGIIIPATGAVNRTDGSLRGFGPGQDLYLQFDSNGNLVPYNPGVNFGTTNASGGEGFNTAGETVQILSDLKRRTANLLGRFAFTDDIEAFFEGSYYHAESFELIDQQAFNATNFTGNSGTITFTSDYPLLTDQARSVLDDNGISSFRLSRALRDLQTNNARGESDLYRGVFGLTGDFEIGEREFTWEVSANRGRYESAFTRTDLNQQNFTNAINVVRDASGRIVCSPTAVSTVTFSTFTPIADPNCVPLDLFGEGRPSAEAQAYVTTPTRATTVLEQEIYTANLSTASLFDLWSGPVGFSIGYEHRNESATFSVDDFLERGLGRAVAILPNEGSYSTDELFAEALIPLVDAADDLPLLKRLDLTGKVRRVDNTINGLFTAYTYGFQWRPFEQFEIRGNKTRSLRAPAVTELFTPASGAFQFVNDPCDSRFITGGTQPATRAANCQAFFEQFGITPPFQSNAVSSTPQGVVTGNPDLENEVADAFAIGFVWKPPFIDGLSLAVDYTEIEIDDVIVLPTATDNAIACFDSPDFDTTDVTRANPFCEQIIRGPDGQITSWITSFTNGEFLNFTGITADLQYHLDLNDYGVFDIGATYFNLRRLETLPLVGGVVDVQAGEIGNSEHQYQLNIAYQKGPYGLYLQANYLSSAQFDVTFTPETRDILIVDGYWLHNAGLSYDIGDNGRVSFAVSNLFDEEPPFGTTNSTYDVLGRRYSLSLEWNFL